MSDQEIIEVLATKGMGWEFWPSGETHFGKVDKGWNPLTDRNAVAAIEARLKLLPAPSSTEMTPYRRYVSILAERVGVNWHNDPYTECAWAIRHASPRVCCEALVKVLTAK